MEDLEDSLASLPAAPKGEEVTQLPRKLGRLRKAKEAVKNTQPDQKAEPPSPAKPAASERDEAEAEASDQEPGSPFREQEGRLDEEQEAAPSPSGHEEDYYDEEDELERHYARCRQAAAASVEASTDEEEGGRGGGAGGCDTEPEMSGASGGSPGGSPGTMELLALDTQRILREAAAHDRLGRGHKIEIKPLSSILDRIKQRQALAIARAPKPAMPDVGSFEDILAQARQQMASAAAAVAIAEGGQGAPGEQQGAAAAANEHAGADAVAAGKEGTAGGQGSRDGDDLLIMGSDEEEVAGGDVRLVELPSTIKKAKRMPFIRTQEDDFEEVLIDDGYNSLEEEEEEEEHEGGRSAETDSSDAEEEEEGGEEVDQRQGSPAGSAEEEGNTARGSSAEAMHASPAQQAACSEGGGSQRQAGATPPGEDSQGEDAEMEEEEEEDATPSSAFNGAAAPAVVVPKRKNKVQRLFLDMEAELSDEEGGVTSSEDEDDDLDDHGELAGLIGQAKETAKDRKMRQLLHREWAERQDDKELQQVMRGLKNGFRRRRGAGFLDDNDNEMAGRRRRGRTEDEDEGAGGALPWPSPFGEMAGSDDEVEDEDLLRRAKQGLLLAESQGMELEEKGSGGLGGGRSLGDSGGIPLDEGSQEVLSLLARSFASEPQMGSTGSASLPRSRFAPQGVPASLASLGSDLSNNRLPGGSAAATGSLSRGPSFVGRQQTVHRVASSSGMGVGGRSFVFGRDDSNSVMLADKDGMAAAETAGSGGEAAGPTSFANLRQMAGMLPPGAQHRKRAGTTLVSRLKAPGHRVGKEPVGSQPSESIGVDAAAAVVALLAGGARGAK